MIIKASLLTVIVHTNREVIVAEHYSKRINEI
jgi:hypothetical protein